MRTKLLLRIAVACIAIHLLGHLVGHFTWKESNGNASRAEVVRQMTEKEFDFMGATRSFGDYYEGYSAILLIVYLTLIMLLLAISKFAEHQPQTARNLIGPISMCLIAFGILEFVYFFPFAASMSTIAGLATLLSMIGLTQKQKN
ncbi:hypothetical protein [Chryseolinea sp. H1M3-3]|uniref:LIC_13387 family protein n=1 Tax=Chryseolinea sp. H1M3-3 TaxID=3034144 RepID=UPI0023ED98D6|nr:hypothetical protein [Chryseolinea sp. H1M3-3]